MAATQGANPEDVAKVKKFAHEHGLDVVDVSLPRRRLRLSGAVQNLSVAFGVQLQKWESPAGRYRGLEGAVQVPADLQDIIFGVFGLDTRPQARPHFRRLDRADGAGASLANSASSVAPRVSSASFTPPKIAKLYNFPADVLGHGQCIAIIELGGGYRATDIKAEVAKLGLRVPKVTSKSVDHGHNHPTNANSADGEAMLDIEIAGAVAPAARIVVYFAPNTDDGFLDAVTTAVHDTLHHPRLSRSAGAWPRRNGLSRRCRIWTRHFRRLPQQA